MEARYKEAAQHLERAMIMGRADSSVAPSTVWAFKLAIQLLLVAEQNKTRVTENKFGCADECNRI